MGFGIFFFFALGGWEFFEGCISFSVDFGISDFGFRRFFLVDFGFCL